MRFLKSLRLQFFPPRIVDPDFGALLYMHIANAPERSYWECEWRFPATGEVVSIGIPGDETGPDAEGRRFFLSLPERHEKILGACRPGLQEVFAHWLDRELPADLSTELVLSGFGLEDPHASPLEWEVGFETTGETWLSITIPFVGERAQQPIVDT